MMLGPECDNAEPVRAVAYQYRPRAARQLKKAFMAAARSGDADVARFW